MNRPFRCVELCAGAGGQAVGLHKAGFRHSALVEIDPNAAETLRVNGSRTRWWPKKAVHEISIKEWKVPSGFPDIDLVAGGVPCPPFSVAGQQAGPEDERDLFPAFLDIVDSLNPRAVMIENVKGLLGKKFNSYRSEVLERLLEMGYEAEWELLEAHDFGVPQLRPRSILVGAKPDVWKYFKWPTPTGRRRTVGEALLPLMSSAGWEGAEAWAAKADVVAPTLVGGSKKHGGADVGPTRAKREWAERLGVNGKSFANECPEPGYRGMPKLTIEMAAEIQAFPSSWHITGLKTARYRQIGNAFPPPVATALGKQIRSALESADQHFG